jgi:hypothetical protein
LGGTPLDQAAFLADLATRIIEETASCSKREATEDGEPTRYR